MTVTVCVTEAVQELTVNAGAAGQLAPPALLTAAATSAGDVADARAVLAAEAGTVAVA